MSNTNNIEEPVVKKAETEGTVPPAQKEEAERVVKALSERLESYDNNRKDVQDKLHSMCEVWRKEIDDLEDKINGELEAKFKEEDSRLQAAMNNLQGAVSADEEKLTEALQKARANLLVVQRYSLNEKRTKRIEKENESDDENDENSDDEDEEEESGVPVELFERLELKTVKEIVPEWFDCSKPRDLKTSKVSNTGRIFLSFTRNTEQERVLSEKGLENAITYKALLQKKSGESGKEYNLRKEERCFSFVPDFLEAEKTYTVKVKAELQ